LLIATITVCGWLEPAKCCARLLRRANYPRQFGGGAVIFLAHERIPRMRWRRPHTIHPAVPELREQLRTGDIDRREFLRTVTLLGVTASAAYAMVGRLTGQPLVPRVQAAGKMGGNLRCSMRVQPMTDPATFDWGEKSNQARHILEYLTITGGDNITRPYLAEAWEASEDLRTWTLKLRQGVHWSNGEMFNADDVVYTSHAGLTHALVRPTSGCSTPWSPPLRRVSEVQMASPSCRRA
jgi:hypothetical protein